MNNPVIKIINYIEQFRETNPIRFKILMIGLCCLAPLEMLCIWLGLFGYKKLSKHFSKSVMEEMK